MELPFDFGGVESKTLGEFLPEGKFECRVKEAKMKRSSRKGTPFIELTWECVEEGDLKGAVTIERKYLTKATAPYLKGWSHKVMNVHLGNKRINEKIYEGRFAKIVVQEYEETYEGETKTRQNVDSWKSDMYFKHNKEIDGSTNASNETIEDIPQEASVENNSSNDGDGGYNPADEDFDDLPF